MQTVKAVVKAAEYRGLTDALSQAFASLRSAATSEERVREAGWVKRAASRLMNAECPRARQEDRDEAERLIDRTAKYLIEAGLAGAR